MKNPLEFLLRLLAFGILFLSLANTFGSKTLAWIGFGCIAVIALGWKITVLLWALHDPNKERQRRR
jgi:hypothetical protein